MRNVATGEQYSIFEDLGPGSTSCHLEGAGALAAAEAVRKDIAVGCQLVVLSKFGKLEAGRAGLASAFRATIDARVPLLTSVSPAFAEAWEKFAPASTNLIAEAEEIEAWRQAICAEQAIDSASIPSPSSSLHNSERRELRSPACLAHEMEDSYMGFAPREELLAALNELLEAERAGARVTMQTIKEAPQALQPVIMAVQRDEAHWCGVLTGAIHRLQGDLSRNIGDFYGKAMAISDLGERLALLNRGQGCVVRKLEELLPKIRDDALHADLAAMLKSHRDNISLVASYAQRQGTRGTP